MIEKRYLGDSVYAKVAGGMIELSTENGMTTDPSNTIFLEIGVYWELVRFARAMGWPDERP